MNWWVVGIIAIVAYELGRSHEARAILANSPGARAAQQTTGVNPIIAGPGAAKSTPTSGVVSAVNPPGSSAWMP